MSFPTTSVLDNFDAYSAGALPSPWAIAFGDSSAAVADGSGHLGGANITGYSASYHTALGSLTDTEVYYTILTPPSHFSGDGIFLQYRSQNVSGGGAPTSSQNGYALNLTGDGFSGWHWSLTAIGGSTLIANTAITPAAGDKFGVSVVGTTHTVWYAPAGTGVWGSLGSATDATYSSGWVGIEFHNQVGQTQPVLDDFGGGAPVADVSSARTRVTIPNNRVGPMALRNRFRRAYLSPTVQGILYTLTLSDTTTASDAIVKGMQPTYADTTTESDAVAKNVGKPETDTTAQSDATVKSVGKAEADTSTQSDSVAKSIGKAETDTSTQSDATAKSVGKAEADTSTQSDAVAKTVGKSEADSSTLSDAFSRVVSFLRSLVDTITQSDSASVVKPTPVHTMSAAASGSGTLSPAPSGAGTLSPASGAAGSISPASAGSGTISPATSDSATLTPDPGL